MNGEPGSPCRARVSFTRDGSAVLFGLAPAPLDSIPADSLADKAVVDLWHYRDAAAAAAAARRGRPRPRARVHGGVPPAGAGARRTARHRHALARHGERRRAHGARRRRPAVRARALWGDGGTTCTCSTRARARRTLVARQVPSPGTLSPGGRYVTWFADGRWKLYDVASRAQRDLTGGLRGVRFDQETWDTPGAPAPWGAPATRTASATRAPLRALRRVGGRPVGAAAGARGDRLGRRAQRARAARRRARTTTARSTRGSRSCCARSTKHEGERLLPRPARRRGARPSGSSWPTVASARRRRRGTPRRTWSRGSTFAEFPNLYAGPSLDALTKISDANPQQKEYNWGTAELVTWTSVDGSRCRASSTSRRTSIRAKKYPMVVVLLRAAVATTCTSTSRRRAQRRSTRRTTRRTATSCSCRTSTTDRLPGTERDQVDRAGRAELDRARLRRSEGASASRARAGAATRRAYMITQTHMFPAAMAGAPVVNMTSAYGGIRWGAGVARAFQYENRQSRIGGTPWEAPMRYMENSPLFCGRPRDDAAVHHEQRRRRRGALVPGHRDCSSRMRRLGKEVYLHQLQQRRAQPAQAREPEGHRRCACSSSSTTT